MKQKLHSLTPYLFALLGYIYDIFFILHNGRNLLDSDMASEMVLANLMNKEHALITKNWIYSTEIKAVGTQWFYCIGLWLSKDNWLVARTIGAAIGLFVLLLSWFYLVKVLEWGQSGKWIIAFLSWPFGFWYFFDVILGNYYIPHSIFMVLSLALMIALTNKINSYVKWILLAIVSIMAGLNGMRMIVIFYLPLFVAGCFFVYASIRKEEKIDLLLWVNKKHSFAVIALYALIFDTLGYAINLKYFVNRYHFVNTEGMVWGKGSSSLIQTFKWYFDSFGFTDFATKEVFSLSGIGAGCGLVLGFAVLFSVVRLAINYKKLDENSQIYIISLFSIFLVVGVVFTYAWGEEQYWLPIVQFGVGALFLELKTDDIFKDFERIALHYIIIVFAIISAVGTVKANIAQPLRANINFEPVVSFLQEEGYTQGVASFWRSQVVTELTDGQIEMWTMNDEYDSTFLWLQSNDHRDIPTGQFFGLYLAEDEEGVKTFSETFGLKGKLVYEDDRYLVYEYQN